MDVPPLPTAPFEGLVAAPHTPFDDAGELVLAPVEAQAERLLEDGVRAVYVAGATGEGLSLSVSERERLFERWVELAAASVTCSTAPPCIPPPSVTLARSMNSSGASVTLTFL